MTLFPVLPKISVIRILLFYTLIIFSLKVSGQLQEGEKRVIFLKETPVYFHLTKDSIYSRFTPTVTNIDSADLFLRAYLLKNKYYDNTSVNLDAYFRQYVGILLNGQQTIFVNASCRKPEYFLENTYYPKGGGSCYFQTLIDISNRKVFKFFFNAPK